MSRTVLLLIDATSGGGIASWAEHLSDGLVRRGWSVEVFGKRLRPEEWAAARDRPIRFHRVSGRNWKEFKGIHLAAAVLPHLVGRKRPVVIAGTWHHAEALVFVRRIFPCVLICSAHGTDIAKAIVGNRLPRMRRTLRRVDLFAPASRFLETMVARAAPDLAVPTELIYNGIDIDRFPAEATLPAPRARFALDPEDFVVLAVGRFLESKGFETVLRAAARLATGRPRLRVLIAGAELEPEAGRLRALAGELGIGDRVRFLGPVPYESMPQLYGAADVFVSASHPVRTPTMYQEEAGGMVLLEAAACGVPSVGTRCGGIPEFILDGETGFLVPPKDPESLAARIAYLIEHPDERARMGIAARANVERNFTRETTAANYAAAIARISGRVDSPTA